ncbi:MAG TPA: hypothetical protein VNK41_11030 [Vicinamibacterales bacterium]|nr:hypothetical protein [Vicinamibacterales bacterium]
MKALIRVCLPALLLAAAVSPAARAQEASAGGAVTPALKAQVLERYQVLVIRDGIVLTPRTGDRIAIEIVSEGIAIDGRPVTGAEVRERLGGDAPLILQLSYAAAADVAALRAAFETSDERAGASAAPPAPAEPPRPQEPPRMDVEDEGEHDGREWRRSGASRVRFAGNVHVDEDEHLTAEVVTIFGSAAIDGRVDGDVVAVMGGVRLGPKAIVNGQVVSVGGGIDRAPGARVRGDVVEVAFVPRMFGPMVGFGHVGSELFSGWARLMGTGLRIGLMLLVSLAIVAIAGRPVSRIAQRVGEDPWVCGFVGLAAEVLFVPVLIITIVFLAISIIGIPLLLLIPFALVGLLIGVLMGFAGVARRIGGWVVGPDRSPMIATAVGVVLIAAGAVLARLLWLIPGPIGPIAFTVGAIGLFLEYVAWTVGLGALLLTRFGTQPRTPYPPPDAWQAPPSSTPLEEAT